MDAATASRALRTEEAISKYPVLKKLSSVSDIHKVAKYADLLKCNAKEVSGVVNLILSKNVDLMLATYVQMIPKDLREDALAAYKEEKFPLNWIVEAVNLIYARGAIK